MGYDDVLDAAFERVRSLPPRARAALFWAAGVGLRAALDETARAPWDGWFDEADRLAVDYVLTGNVPDGAGAVRDRASADTGPDATQLLNSAVICASTPVIVALDPDADAGPWIEHAFFPVVEVVSLDLWEDVSFPDDEGLDEVHDDERFRAAARWLDTVCTRLEAGPVLDRDALESLLDGVSALAGR